MADEFDLREVERLVAGATASQAALDAWLAGLDPVDPATPSRLPDWTVGHVLTHLARNADSHVRMLAGEPQYAGGSEQRAADIEAGAGRWWPALLDDLGGAHAALVAAWHGVPDWTVPADRLNGSRPLGRLPFFRWREVEVHRADLGLAYTFADMPGDYVRRELACQTMAWRAAKPIGLTELPEPALQAPPAQRLAWLLGRAEIAGLAPAGIF